VSIDPIITHLQANWQIYALIAAGVIPILYVTRRYSVPAILWSFEIIIYTSIFHVVMHGLVALVRWFKYNSEMEMPQFKTDPGWKTPLLEFWQTDLYSPHWVLYIEIAALVFFTALVLRMRPIKPQKAQPKAPPKRPGQPGYRPGQTRGNYRK